jgi:MFS family permease
MRRLNFQGAWAPLAEPVFRALWIAAVASNIGTWMQSVGAAWLMTSLTTSPLLIALLTTASSLPIFLAGLPAGALADVFDRRHLVLLT